jgi:hypothetical protein
MIEIWAIEPHMQVNVVATDEAKLDLVFALSEKGVVAVN